MTKFIEDIIPSLDYFVKVKATYDGKSGIMDIGPLRVAEAMIKIINEVINLSEKSHIHNSKPPRNPYDLNNRDERGMIQFDDPDDAEEYKNARELLLLSDYVFDDEDFKDGLLRINLNDVWCWACAQCEPIPNEKVVEVARLFRKYGWCGLLYWASEQDNQCRSEFHDNNRFIDFVRKEEEIIKEVPDYNKRGYHKTTYALGDK